MDSGSGADGAEVVVIGAGLAGIAASLHLGSAGMSVLLLDAAAEVGGRVRTTVVDGYRLDHGFQVHDTAYPEPARLLDAPSLHLRPFRPGALVARDGRLHRVMDPRRRPRDLLATLRAPIGPLRDKVLLAALAARVVATPPRRLRQRPERTTRDALAAAGLSDEIVGRFLEPFLSGVLLERDLTTSSRFFELVLRCFALGDQCVPAAGIGAIPRQLAGRLAPGALQLGRPVAAVEAGGVLLEGGGRVRADAVVVATDPGTAVRLVPELGPAPAMHPVTTVYHAADRSPVGEPVLVLDGERRGLAANSVVLSDAAPGYAPAGRALISTSVVATDADEGAVRAQLRGWYGGQVDDWEHLETYRVPAALPDQAPPLGDLRRPVRVRPGLYVAGDWRDTASTQGALVSGRRAAHAVATDLGRRPTVETGGRATS